MNPIMAHRGWSSRAPENTLAAIKLAVFEHWIDSVEVDVQLTKDGVPIIIHDFQVNRTTNGVGFVKDFTFAKLRKLDAGSWFDPRFSREKVPSLEEVLKLCKGKTRLNLEIKNSGDKDDRLLRKVVQLINRFQMEKEVIITSFDHEEIKKVQRISNQIETGIIVEGNPPFLNEILEETGANTISMSFFFLTKRLVEKHLSAGRRLIVWTPNNIEEITFVMEMSKKIEICTNFPERVLGISSDT